MPTVVDSVRLEPRPASHQSPVQRPRVSWVTRTDVPGWRQHSAELELSDADAAATHLIEGDASVLVDWPFAPLVARQRGRLRVRVQGPDGWSAWSEPRDVQASFLDAGEWQAPFIGLAAPETPAQPALLRTEFDVAPGLVRATLYATAQGVYAAEVNGRLVDDQLLKPGWTPYQYRLVHETTDVTDLLTTGRNAIGVTLAGGWYTESFGFQGLQQPFYGSQPSFAGQLLLEYADGSAAWIVTGAGWQATASGPVTAAGIYVGETYDARLELAGWSAPGYDDAAWKGTREIAWDLRTLEAPLGPPMRRTQKVAPVSITQSPSGKTLVDFGQNLVGRLAITVQGLAGQTVTLRHAERADAGEAGHR